GGDPVEDLALLRALPRGLRVAHDVAAARVQEAVEAAGGPLAEVHPFDEHRPVAAHGRVADDARAGGAPADHKHVRLEPLHATPARVDHSPRAILVPPPSTGLSAGRGAPRTRL